MQRVAQNCAPISVLRWKGTVLMLHEKTPLLKFLWAPAVLQDSISSTDNTENIKYNAASIIHLRLPGSHHRQGADLT